MESTPGARPAPSPGLLERSLRAEYDRDHPEPVDEGEEGDLPEPPIGKLHPLQQLFDAYETAIVRCGGRLFSTGERRRLVRALNALQPFSASSPAGSGEREAEVPCVSDVVEGLRQYTEGLLSTSAQVGALRDKPCGRDIWRDALVRQTGAHNVLRGKIEEALLAERRRSVAPARERETNATTLIAHWCSTSPVLGCQSVTGGSVAACDVKHDDPAMYYDLRRGDVIHLLNVTRMELQRVTSPAVCSCEEWTKRTSRHTGRLMIESIISVPVAFFKYCPWCGKVSRDATGEGK